MKMSVPAREKPNPHIIFTCIGPDENDNRIAIDIFLVDIDKSRKTVGTIRVTSEQCASFLIALERNNITFQVAFTSE